jgi:hypothetical protein
MVLASDGATGLTVTCSAATLQPLSADRFYVLPA